MMKLSKMILINKTLHRFYMDVYADGEDVEARIAKARQEEKDKLYPEITVLKDKVTVLTNNEITKDKKITELDGEITKLTGEITKLTGELEKAKKATEDAKNTANGTKDQQVVALTKTIEDLTTSLSTIKSDFQKQLEEAQSGNSEKMKQLNLEIFKKEKLLEAGDAIIREMVTGTTEDEIVASITTAQAKYKEIAERTLSGVTVVPANPHMGSGLARDKSPEEIAKMTSKEYAEYRKSIGFHR